MKTYEWDNMHIDPMLFDNMFHRQYIDFHLNSGFFFISNYDFGLSINLDIELFPIDLHLQR